MLSTCFAALLPFIPGAGHEVTGGIDIANPAQSCGTDCRAFDLETSPNTQAVALSQELVSMAGCKHHPAGAARRHCHLKA